LAREGAVLASDTLHVERLAAAAGSCHF
jgi:hypothetical protein